jgi:hypothetical protein
MEPYDTTYNPPQFPPHEIVGMGMHEAPRGALSHWVVIEKGAFTNYQAVVPTTWNARPRDQKGPAVVTIRCKTLHGGHRATMTVVTIWSPSQDWLLFGALTVGSVACLGGFRMPL